MKFKNSLAVSLAALLAAPIVDTLTLARRRFLDRFNPEHSLIPKAPTRALPVRKRHPVLIGLPDEILPFDPTMTRQQRLEVLKEKRWLFAEKLKGTLNAYDVPRCRQERKLAARLAVRYAPQFA